MGYCLFACCVPVRGAKRSLICDLQRSQYIHVSNELCDLFLSDFFLSDRIFLDNRSDQHYRFDELRLLAENEFVFRCSEKQSRLFERIKLNWSSSDLITNAIIDTNGGSDHQYWDIFCQLNELGCRAAQLRFFDGCQGVVSALEAAQANGFIDLELIVPDIGSGNAAIGAEWAQEFKILTKIIFHSASSNALLNAVKGTAEVYQVTNQIKSADHCGFVHPDGFVVGSQMFSEALNHNTCLNGKLSIDVEGNIKNCPAMTRTFGKVGLTGFLQVLKLEEFKRLWQIKKDEVSVCRDCEFRYICLDCRAHLSNSSDIYSKPAKCTYDPYTATWRT